MKRLKGNAQSHPQHSLCLLPAALNWSGSLNGSNSRRLVLILMSHLQTRQRVRSHRAASTMMAPQNDLLFFSLALSLFCALIFLTRRVPHRKLSDASRPLPWMFACVKNTVSSHGWTFEFKGNVNNSAIDGAAWLFRMDYTYALGGATLTGKKTPVMPTARRWRIQPGPCPVAFNGPADRSRSSYIPWNGFPMPDVASFDPIRCRGPHRSL